MSQDNLTTAQHGRLARMARETPDAKVVGYEWRGEYLLPHVQRPGHSHRIRVKPDGRVTTVRRDG